MMRLRDAQSVFQNAVALRRYAGHPLTWQDAFDDVQRRMDDREKNFLQVVRDGIYAHRQSPYRALLSWAGCRYDDLEQSVRRHGLESTLKNLKEAGVYVSLEEFKSKIPICRKGLTIEPSESDFDNPLCRMIGIRGSTSGSRSKRVQVGYNWDFMAQEASNELLLYTGYGLKDAPVALWLPTLPCLSGIHNLLMDIKYRKIPDKWFSQLQTEDSNVSSQHRTVLNNMLLACRIAGYRVPKPEFAGIDDGEKLARWMETTAKKKGLCMVRTYASSAIRLVQAAIEKGIDISGNVISTGAEPLTPQRASFIQSAGVEPLTRYVATETGLLAASCKEGEICDDMHVYLDRHAIIQRRRKTEIGDCTVDAYLFTSLLSNVGKIMFNTELGDFGQFTERPCNCVFGQLGMNIHVAEVRSFDKLSCEGMTLLGSDLDTVVAGIIRDVGGGPDDYQFWETEDEVGMPRLIIAVSPDLQGLDEKRFVNTVMKKLRENKITLASQFWEQADTLRLTRSKPEYTQNCKMLPILRR